MPTLIYYECRDALHLAAPSRLGIGGVVFVVAAAMRFATFVDRPRAISLRLMCSYWRVRFLLFTPRGGTSHLRTRFAAERVLASCSMTVSHGDQASRWHLECIVCLRALGAWALRGDEAQRRNPQGAPHR